MAWYTGLVSDTISQVSTETVLSDTSGLHMGAGPYFLFYARRSNALEHGAHESQRHLDTHLPQSWPSGYLV